MPDAEPVILDYAPPQRRVPWLTWRRATFLILLIATAISAWIIVPRVLQRAELLHIQSRLREPVGDSKSSLLEVWVPGDWPEQDTLDSMGVFFNPTRDQFAEALDSGIGRAVARWMRTPAGEDRLVIVTPAIRDGAVKDVTQIQFDVIWQVYQPATLTRGAKLLSRGGLANVPFAATPNTKLLVWPAEPEATDPTRFVLDLFEVPRTWFPDDRSRSEPVLGRIVRVEGRLLNDSSIRLRANAVERVELNYRKGDRHHHVPASKPHVRVLGDAAPPVTRKSSKLAGDDPVAQPSAGGTP